jgi:hypothetical protein
MPIQLDGLPGQVLGVRVHRVSGIAQLIKRRQ